MLKITYLYVVWRGRVKRIIRYTEMEHRRSGRSDVQNYTSPHDRLGFLKINSPTIQSGSESDNDGRPA